MNKPKQMYRPSDNQVFTLTSSGGYSSGPRSTTAPYDYLISLGFRDHPFTTKEMISANSIKIKCKINGTPSIIEISEKEWDKL